jgi:hypothetical protein
MDVVKFFREWVGNKPELKPEIHTANVEAMAFAEAFYQRKINSHVVRHSDEMIEEEYVYKSEFRFQRTQRHGVWFVTHNNQLITFGQYRSDLEEWIDKNY